jgi:hypothetical protein
MYVQGIRALFAFEGYVVSKITMSGEVVQVNLRRDRRFRLACPACGATMGANRTTLQTARDMPWGPATLVLIIYEAI